MSTNARCKNDYLRNFSLKRMKRKLKLIKPSSIGLSSKRRSRSLG